MLDDLWPDHFSNSIELSHGECSNSMDSLHALQWAEESCQQSKTLPSEPHMGSSVRRLHFAIESRNASDKCDSRMSLPIMSGYLSRRYEYTGAVFSLFSVFTVIDVAL